MQQQQEETSFRFKRDMVKSNKVVMDIDQQFQKILIYFGKEGQKIKELAVADCQNVENEIKAHTKQNNKFFFLSSNVDKIGVFKYLGTIYGYVLTSFAWEKLRFYRVQGQTLYYLSEIQSQVYSIKQLIFNFEKQLTECKFINIYTGEKFQNLSQSQIEQATVLSKTAILLISNKGLKQLNFDKEGNIQSIPDNQQNYQWTYQDKFIMNVQIAEDRIKSHMKSLRGLQLNHAGLVRSLMDCTGQYKLNTIESGLNCFPDEKDNQLIQINAKIVTYLPYQHNQFNDNTPLFLQAFLEEYKKQKQKCQISFTQFPIGEDENMLYYKANFQNQESIFVQSIDFDERKELVYDFSKQLLICMKIISNYNYENDNVFTLPQNHQIISMYVGKRRFVQLPLITYEKDDGELSYHIEKLKKFSLLYLQGLGIICLNQIKYQITKNGIDVYPQLHSKESFEKLRTNKGEQKIIQELEYFKKLNAIDSQLQSVIECIKNIQTPDQEMIKKQEIQENLNKE